MSTPKTKRARVAEKDTPEDTPEERERVRAVGENLAKWLTPGAHHDLNRHEPIQAWEPHGTSEPFLSIKWNSIRTPGIVSRLRTSHVSGGETHAYDDVVVTTEVRHARLTGIKDHDQYHVFRVMLGVPFASIAPWYTKRFGDEKSLRERHPDRVRVATEKNGKRHDLYTFDVHEDAIHSLVVRRRFGADDYQVLRVDCRGMAGGHQWESVVHKGGAYEFHPPSAVGDVVSNLTLSMEGDERIRELDFGGGWYSPAEAAALKGAVERA